MSEPTSTTSTAATDDAESRKDTGSHDMASASEAKSTCEKQEMNSATSSTSKPNTPVGPDEEGLIKEMKNFDNLLKMMSVYRDNPDLRGNPNDRNIVEIANVLSKFIGDDPDSFLRDGDGYSSESDDGGDNQVTSNGDTNEPVDEGEP